MLEKYLNILARFNSEFTQYNCSLKIGYAWINFLKDEYSVHRLPLKNGYVCYICCEVQKDGKNFYIESNDGEADYYDLSASWAISSTERCFLKNNVLLPVADDIENDMNELLQLLIDSQ